MHLLKPTVRLGLILCVTGCAARKDAADFSCGLAVLGIPLAVQQAFAHGQAMAMAPWNPHDSISVRMVAGPLFRASVVEGAPGWKVTVAEKLPEGARTGYAVLVADDNGNNHGILLYDGSIIPGAAVIGRVALGDTTFPLIGVRMNARTIEDTPCPIFGTKPE